MAPSGMFSYLRPHHKRSSSGPKPVSPLNPSPLYSADSALSSPDFQVHSQPPRPTTSSSPHSNIPLVSPLPPILPQIPRVASTIDRQRDLSLLDPQNAWSPQRDPREGTRKDSDTLQPASRGEISTGSSPKPLLSVENNAHDNIPQSARSTGSKEYPVGGPLARGLSPLPLTHSPISYSATTAPTSTYYSSSTSNPSTALTYPNPASSSRPVGLNSAPNLNPVPRSGKTKLNLLNPMTLLMRRRANQPIAHLDDTSQDDYDPRIRGRGVRDFDAPPRLRITPEQGNLSPSQTVGRNLGFPQADEVGRRPSAGQDYRLAKADISPGGGRESPIGPRSGEHTPIFKEHFEDNVFGDGDGEAAWRRQAGQTLEIHLGVPGSSQRNAMTPVSQAALHRPPDRSPPPPPPGARDVSPGPIESPPPRSEAEAPSVETIESAHSKPWEPLRDDQQTEGLDEPDSVGVSLADSPAYGSGLPKHFKSNASRFSFEVSGIGSSSQEKLLEEAHRKTMAKRRSELSRKTSSSFVDEFDERFNDKEMGDFDYYEDDGIFEEQVPGVNSDAVNDDDHFEEEIPGVNSDAAEHDGLFKEMVTKVNSDTIEDNYQVNGGIFGFDFGPSAHPHVSSPTTPYSFNGAGAVGTPRDTEGRVIGYAISKESPTLYRNSPADPLGSLTPDPGPGRDDSGDGLGLVGVDISDVSDDDDLYFNDGIIEPPLEDEGEQVFDESVFDSEDNGVFGLPLRDLKPPKIPEPLRASGTTDSSPAKYTSEDDEDDSVVPQDSQATDTAFPPMMNPSSYELGYQASLGQQQSLLTAEHPLPSVVKQDLGGGLTQDNLIAYHNALVAAANAAAANGKLSRRDTASSSDLEDYEGGDPDFDNSTHPGLVPDSGRASEEVETGYGASPSRGFYDGIEDFDYDDGLEDDPIIAEANAEALASDDEGFYGSEFGFYAHAATNEQAEYVAGGYFGPRREITRTMSGRMREPNLTPITERSECSNRTSFAISLHGPQGQPGIASPGLAQLLDMMGGGGEDDDMNLHALMKLRRDAFGGSNGSLRSAGSAASQPGGSPLNFLPPLGSTGIGIPPGLSLTSGAGSSYSVANTPGFPNPNGYASDPDSAPASPTITLGNHALGRWGGPGQRTSGHSEGSSGPSSPLAVTFTVEPATKKVKHKREGSGGDSIAYLREEGEDGERWVLERRRTDEFGEVEIVGREIVEGGRI